MTVASSYYNSSILHDMRLHFQKCPVTTLVVQQLLSCDVVIGVNVGLEAGLQRQNSYFLNN